MEHSKIEIKAVDSDLVSLFDQHHRAFNEFRDENDRRLSRLEKRQSGDVISDNKLDKLQDFLDETKKQIDRLAIERKRPSFASEEKSAFTHYQLEHKRAFHHYMRTGEEYGLKALEAKAMSEGSGPDGGYLVPVPAEQEILRRLAHISPIRSIATVQAISGAQLKKAFSFQGPASGWVGESDPAVQTANQQIADLSFPAMEHYAMPAATQTLLDDAVFDVEQWTASEVETVFAEQEGAAFVIGTGVKQPTGFLTYPKVANSSWSFGNVGYLPTGASGGFAATTPSDILFDLIFSLRAGYRANATFVMSRNTQAAVRKFKSTTGEYLWEPPTSLGDTAKFMGFPIVEAPDMPDIGAGTFSIAFGDFKRGYVVVDRTGIRMLRDPYSAKPYVLFYTTKRVGGGIQDFEAIKLLKFDVS